MRPFGFALIAIVVLASTGLVARAELSMARRGAFTAEDAFSQMGGMPFQMADLPMRPVK